MPHTQFPNLTVLDHPLIRHKLTILRDKHTTTRWGRFPAAAAVVSPGSNGAFHDVTLQEASYDAKTLRCDHRRTMLRRYVVRHPFTPPVSESTRSYNVAS